MDTNRFISAIVKLAVLLIAAGALYYLWGEQFPGAATQNSSQETPLSHTEVAVDVTTIQRATLHAYITAFGSVQPAPATTTRPAAFANITVPTRATVDTITCAEGQLVKRGDPLFTLADPGKVPQTISAPISGTVTTLNISPGGIATPLTTAVQIVDLDHLIIEVTVPGTELPAIKQGQTASIEFPQPIQSTVDRVDPSVDPNTNLGTVDIQVPTGTTLRPGQLAKVSIATDDHANCLVVPAESLVHDSLNRTFIGVVSDDRSKATLELVETGFHDNNLVEVTGPNISEGQTIVTTGAPALLARTDIKINAH